jgi:hypothetical protein
VFRSRVWTHFREMKIEPAREIRVVFTVETFLCTLKTRVNVKVWASMTQSGHMQRDVSKPRPTTYLLFHPYSKGCTSLAFLLVRKPSMFECIEANKGADEKASLVGSVRVRKICWRREHERVMELQFISNRIDSSLLNMFLG